MGGGGGLTLVPLSPLLSDSRFFHGDFFGSSHATDFKIDGPVFTSPGAGRYRGAGSGWPGVSLPFLGEIASWIGSFCLSVAARKLVRAGPSLKYSSMLLGC